MTIYELRWCSDKIIENNSGESVREYFATLRAARARLEQLKADTYHTNLNSDGFKFRVKNLVKADLLLRALNKRLVFEDDWLAVPSLQVNPYAQIEEQELAEGDDDQ